MKTCRQGKTSSFGEETISGSQPTAYLDILVYIGDHVFCVSDGYWTRRTLGLRRYIPIGKSAAKERLEKLFAGMPVPQADVSRQDKRRSRDLKQHWRRSCLTMLTSAATLFGGCQCASQTDWLDQLVLNGGATIPTGPTNFGVILTPPNFPSTSVEDYIAAFDRAKTLGSFTCYIWEWNTGEEGYVNATRVTEEAHKRGFDMLLQLVPQGFGDVTPPKGLGADSFRDPIVQQRFINDAVKLALLKPKWLVLATEINLLIRSRPDEYDAFAELYKQAYRQIKTIAPDVYVGVSYHHTVLLSELNFEIIDQMGPQDFLGFTTYPDALVTDGPFSSSKELPADFYSTLRLLYPDKPIAFTEMGWSTYEDPSMQDQVAYIERLPELLNGVDPILICWAMLHDMTAFDYRYLSQSQQETIKSRFGIAVDVLFERLNHMALLNNDGTPKPGYFTALSIFNNGDEGETP